MFPQRTILLCVLVALVSDSYQAPPAHKNKCPRLVNDQEYELEDADGMGVGMTITRTIVLCVLVTLVSDSYQAPPAHKKKCPRLVNGQEYELEDADGMGAGMTITYCRAGAATRTYGEPCSPDTGDYHLYFLDTFQNCDLPDLVHCNCHYEYYCGSSITPEGLQFKCMSRAEPDSKIKTQGEEKEGSEGMHLGDK